MPDSRTGHIYCLGCGYNVRALAESRCPECGRAFDLDDGDSFRSESVRSQRCLAVLTGCLGVYPIVCVLRIHGTWLVAWMELGRAPRPGLDDPKFISSVVDAFLVAASCLAAMSAPALAISAVLVLGILAVMLDPWMKGYHQSTRATLVSLTILVAGWLGSFAVLRWDPLDAAQWFFD